jgi:hypothetical protein
MKKPNPPRQTPTGAADSLPVAPHRAALQRLHLGDDPTPTVADALASLRAAYTKLTDIPDVDIKAMSDDDRGKWATVADELFRNIRKLETAELQALNQQFQGRVGELATASASLQSKLDGLTKIADVVKAVAAGLSLITNIVGLLA